MDKFISNFLNLHQNEYEYKKNLDAGTYLLQKIKNNDKIVLKSLIKSSEYPGNFDMFKKRFENIKETHSSEIVAPLEIGIINKQFYKIMPYKGFSLKNIIEEEIVSAKNAINIFENLLDTINKFHLNKQIHGNLKSSNVFIEPNGKLLLSDFMFEKSLKDSVYKIPDTTGALIYHRDIYSLGVIFYELLNWELAKNGEPVKKIHIPGNFYTVVDKCCYNYKTCGFDNAKHIMKYLKKTYAIVTEKIKPKDIKDNKIETQKRKRKFKEKTRNILFYLALYLLIGIIALYLYLKKF